MCVCKVMRMEREGGANAGFRWVKLLRSLRARPQSCHKNHHPSLPPPPTTTLVEAAHAVHQHATWLWASDFECGVESGDTALSNIDRKRKKRIPANQDVTDCLPKLFELSIVAVSVNEKKKFFWRFFKKRGKSFLKKRKVKKKKRNSTEKRKIDIPENTSFFDSRYRIWWLIQLDQTTL